MLADAAGDIADATSSRERFGAPPVTILDARDGWWQARKAAWITLGIQSELGRGAVPSGALMPVVNPKTGKSRAAIAGPAVIADTDAKRSATHDRDAPTFDQVLMRGEHKVGERVSDEQASAHADAVDEAIRESVATKPDITRLENRIDLAVLDLPIRMWAVTVALFAALASLKYFG